MIFQAGVAADFRRFPLSDHNGNALRLDVGRGLNHFKDVGSVDLSLINT